MRTLCKGVIGVTSSLFDLVICDEREREIKGENSIRRLGLGSLGSGITALRHYGRRREGRRVSGEGHEGRADHPAVT